MKGKVIFIDTVHPILFERLEAAGYQCEWKNKLSREELLQILPDYSGAVLRSKFIFDAEVFEAGKKLKWIARSGAGMENIDLAYAKKKEVICFNSPEGNRDAVAEHALGMLLSLFNHLNQADREVRMGQWNREKNRGIELMGKTIGILGYGTMGKAFAQRLSGFGVQVMAYDKYKTDYSDQYAREVSLEKLQSEAEVLSIHLPLTAETRGIINLDFLEKFKKPIYLINTARGKNLVTADLLKAIEQNTVLGACLDVLEFEQSSFENLAKEHLPASFQALIASNKVLLSPHVAGWTEESYFKLSQVLADKILAKF